MISIYILDTVVQFCLAKDNPLPSQQPLSLGEAESCFVRDWLIDYFLTFSEQCFSYQDENKFNNIKNPDIKDGRMGQPGRLTVTRKYGDLAREYKQM